MSLNICRAMPYFFFICSTLILNIFYVLISFVFTFYVLPIFHLGVFSQLNFESSLCILSSCPMLNTELSFFIL